MPDRLESGTHNTAGIAGLGAAVDYIMEQTVDKVRRHERELVAHFLDGVKKIPGITIYGPQNPEQKVGVVSLNVANADCGEIGYLLDHVYGIGVRTGLHCAPNAHRTIGTLESGTVRVSFSYFNTHDDVEHCLKALSEIAGNLG
jgi:selenocysteine lyase/cysteine desulfurase